LTWQIEWDDAARRELRSLDAQVQREIFRYLRERISTAEDPSTFGKPLKGKLAGYWRYRVGDYRVICTIENDRNVILVLRAAHRREIYDA
jgi:mRNA interferase RelE/StbE